MGCDINTYRTSDLLIRKIKNQLGLVVKEIRSLHPRTWEKRSGRWSWTALTEDGKEIGCVKTMVDCVKRKYDFKIDKDGTIQLIEELKSEL